MRCLQKLISLCLSAAEKLYLGFFMVIQEQWFSPQPLSTEQFPLLTMIPPSLFQPASLLGRFNNVHWDILHHSTLISRNMKPSPSCSMTAVCERAASMMKCLKMQLKLYVEGWNLLILKEVMKTNCPKKKFSSFLHFTNIKKYPVWCKTSKNSSTSLSDM